MKTISGMNRDVLNLQDMVSEPPLSPWKNHVPPVKQGSIYHVKGPLKQSKLKVNQGRRSWHDTSKMCWTTETILDRDCMAINYDIGTVFVWLKCGLNNGLTEKQYSVLGLICNQDGEERQGKKRAYKRPVIKPNPNKDKLTENAYSPSPNDKKLQMAQGHFSRKSTDGIKSTGRKIALYIRLWKTQA